MIGWRIVLNIKINNNILAKSNDLIYLVTFKSLPNKYTKSYKEDKLI